MKNYSYIVVVPITNLIVTPKQQHLMNILPNVGPIENQYIVVVPLAEKCSMKLFPKGNSHLLVAQKCSRKAPQKMKLAFIHQYPRNVPIKLPKNETSIFQQPRNVPVKFPKNETSIYQQPRNVPMKFPTNETSIYQQPWNVPMKFPKK